jgi:hypothetical protein
MASTVNVQNSFVTFGNRGDYITDTDCGIVKDFCFPFLNGADLAFQINFKTNEVAENFTFSFFSNKNNVSTEVTNVAIEAYQVDSFTVGLYVDFVNSNLGNEYNEGECFNLSIVAIGSGGSSYIFTSDQCFQKSDDCGTAVLSYWNEEDAFGFDYFVVTDTQENNYNRIRLPLYFKSPNVRNNQKVYVRSNGSRKKLFARLSMQYQCITDMMTEEAHRALNVALQHDEVNFRIGNPSIKSFNCTFEDEYNNQFPNMMQPINSWPADFLVYETPFNEVNSNCQ